jgi:hypothetical protein
VEQRAYAATADITLSAVIQPARIETHLLGNDRSPHPCLRCRFEDPVDVLSRLARTKVDSHDGPTDDKEIDESALSIGKLAEPCPGAQDVIAG